MIKIENVEVLGWKHVIRGMRNPKNSWDRMDSFFWEHGSGFEEAWGLEETVRENVTSTSYHIGPNDHKLMMQLASGGPVHAKYRRMIIVYLDITAPLYWWKEFDTYKVGTVANSCSTMHKIHDKEFTLDDFSHEHLHVRGLKRLVDDTHELNFWRNTYLNGGVVDNEDGTSVNLYDPKSKDAWWQMIQLLPSSYNQKRTIMLNYEVLVGIYTWRKNHKLDEWRTFCEWIESLPYSELIIGEKL